MSKNDLVYFAPHFDMEEGVPGVRDKILCQAKVLTQGGWQVHPVGWHSFAPLPLAGAFLWKLCRFIPNTIRSAIDDRSCYQRAFEQIEKIKPGVVFIRYRYFSGAFLHFLKRLKYLPEVPKVVMEIATWPYDKERTPLDLRTWEDRYCRNRLHGLLDRIVTFTNHDRILGIRTIKTRNGINVDAVPYQGPAHFVGSHLELIAGSNMAFSRNLLKDTGGFSTDFGMVGNNLRMGEETELFRRIWQKNPLFWYDPALCIQHYVPAKNLKISYRMRRRFSNGLAAGRMETSSSNLRVRIKRLIVFFYVALVKVPRNIIETGPERPVRIVKSLEELAYILGKFFSARG